MAGFERTPRFLLRLIQTPPRLAYALGLGRLIGRVVLLLTTTGRKTGKRRVTPLQYEQVDGMIYVAAARGAKTDWYRNLLANPQVELRLGARCLTGTAEPITQPGQVADFLELRLQRHPRMVGAILRLEGLPAHPSRGQLEAYAASRVVVAITVLDSPPN